MKSVMPQYEHDIAQIIRKSDIFHKVDMGILFDIYYDTETTDLDKRFAEITQFGGLITDLAGNVLHTINLRARISPYTVISPYAWLVQKMKYDDLSKGLPRPVFMGQVSNFFELTNRLNQAPFLNDFLKLCRSGSYTNERHEEERYYSYPVLNDDGTIDWDFLRIHENLKKFYFNDPRVGRWVKRDIKSMSIGYNNINADDQWLWTAGHMAGASNIFITHLSQRGKLRLDGLRVVEAAVIAGKAGENRLRAGEFFDPKSGQMQQSYSLGSVLEANTRHSSVLRGILEGITREDGSFIDLKQLHGALADSYALLALTRYIRQVHPNILRQMESNTDWKDVIARMSDVSKNFGNNPPLGYVDKKYPTIDGKMISLIGTDQHRNAPKVSVVWNLAIDPQTYTFNGKKIDQLSDHEWSIILKDARENPNAPLKVIHAHKSPRILEETTAYEAGFNLNIDRTMVNDRIRFLARARITDSVMAGLRLAYPRKFGVDRLILPQPEEELFTFTTLELFDKDNGDDVQVHHRIYNRVEEMAQKSRNQAMQVKSLWLEAIFFDEDIFINSDGEASQFIEKIKLINKKLKKIEAPLIPEFDEEVIDYNSALNYKIKILFYARNNFVSGAIQDIGHHFWFEDSDGVRFSDETIKSWKDYEIDDAVKTGSLHIRHEIVNTTPLIIDRMIEDMGFSHILGDQIRAQLDAYKKLRQFGLPHNQDLEDRWNTVQKAYKDLVKIENNEVQALDLVAVETFIPGAWEKFMNDNHESISSLLDYRRYLESISAKDRLLVEDMPYVGIDPQTQYPQKNFDFAVQKNDVVFLDIPDRYIDFPTIDPITKRPLWILPLLENFNRMAKGSENIILRAHHSGRLYHLANAKCVNMPPPISLYDDFYKAVGVVYDQSAVPLPDKKELSMALIGSGPYPLFHWRNINMNAQSLHIPRSQFEGLAAPMLAGYKHRPHGILVYDDHLELEPKAIRIREVNGEQITGWEYEADVVQSRRVTFDDIQTFDQATIIKYGFETNEQLYDFFTRQFSEQKKDPRNKLNTMLAIDFSRIDVRDENRGMVFFKPDAQMISCVSHSNP